MTAQPGSSVRPRVQLEAPGDLIAALPHLLGFHPVDSLIVVGLLGGEATMLGVTLRADLPPPGSARLLAKQLVVPLTERDTSAVALIVIGPQRVNPFIGLPHQELLAACEDVFADAGILVDHQLWAPSTTDGVQWRCYEDESCAGVVPDPYDTPLAALSAAIGVRTYNRREDIAATLAPVAPDVLARRVNLLEAVSMAEPDQGVRPGRGAQRLALVQATVRAFADDEPELTDDDVVHLADALSDHRVRDACLDLGPPPDPSPTQPAAPPPDPALPVDPRWPAPPVDPRWPAAPTPPADPALPAGLQRSAGPAPSTDSAVLTDSQSPARSASPPNSAQLPNPASPVDSASSAASAEFVPPATSMSPAHFALRTDTSPADFALDTVSAPDADSEALASAVSATTTAPPALPGPPPPPAIEDTASAERLWAALVRATPAPERAESACLLAFSAYIRGDGVFAGIALEQAEDADPGHRLAALLRDALLVGLAPERLRAAGVEAAFQAHKRLAQDR